MAVDQFAEVTAPKYGVSWLVFVTGKDAAERLALGRRDPEQVERLPYELRITIEPPEIFALQVGWPDHSGLWVNQVVARR